MIITYCESLGLTEQAAKLLENTEKTLEFLKKPNKYKENGWVAEDMAQGWFVINESIHIYG